MGELERVKAALDAAINGLRFAGYTQTIKDVEAILNPPPEVETVEAEHWHVYNRGFRCFAAGTKAECLVWVENCRDRASMEIVKLTGTFQRPKPAKVERSVVNCDVAVTSTGGIIGIHGGSCSNPFPHNKECHGKHGVLTFTWQE